ncbi:MAG TPA: hypothetical protein DCL54_14255 [Alphaproteobacteria bacterium]|nr:hypothetical protein [Alphaproteobacteria bacterium]
MRSVITVLLGLIALGVLGYFCFQHHQPGIEADLRGRADAALRVGGFDFATVRSVDGRDVVLEGEAPSLDAKQRALAAVDEVWGIRAAVDRMTVTGLPAGEPAPAQTASPAGPVAGAASGLPYFFKAEYSGPQLMLTGAVPSEAFRQSLLASIRAQFPGVTVLDNLVVREGAPDAAWPDVVTDSLSQLARFTRGNLEIEGQQVRLAGEARTEADRQSADSVLQRLPAGYQGRLDASVAAAPVAVAPPETVPPVAAPVAPPTAPPAPTPQPKPEPQPLPEAEPQPAATPTAAETAAAKKCGTELNNAMRRQTILFQSGSAVIDRSSQAVLRRLARIANGCPKARITVVGHTDNEGVPAFNQRLSEARARAVREALARYGVAAGRVGIRGYGATRPATNNRSARGRAQNRRIEFVVR